MRDAWGEFEKRGSMSPHGEASHAKYRTKYQLPFTVLADEGHAVADRSGVWVEKSVARKKYIGVERSTFVIDAEGALAKVLRRVKPDPRGRRPRRASGEVAARRQIGHAAAAKRPRLGVFREQTSRGRPLFRQRLLCGHSSIAVELVPRLVSAEEPPRALQAGPDDQRPVEHQIERGEQQEAGEIASPVRTRLEVVEQDGAGCQSCVHEGDRKDYDDEHSRIEDAEHQRERERSQRDQLHDRG